MIALRRLLERDRAHVVAPAAGPDQVDVGGVLRARDLDAARGEVGVEVAAFGEAAVIRALLASYRRVVEHRAGLRRNAPRSCLR